MFGKNRSVGVTICLAAFLLWANGCARAAMPAQDGETPEIKRMIDQAQAALGGKKATVSDLLANPVYLPAHGEPRFRQLIRQHAQAAPLTITAPQEPGAALTVTGVMRDKDGQPLANALVYVYQTNSQGLYTDAGRGGGQRHSRLFGYLLTDAQGRYELRTNLTGSYPQTSIAQHIHLEIEPTGGGNTFVTEIVFDDDKNLTEQTRAQAIRAGYAIVTITLEGQKQRAVANFQLP